MIYVYFYISQDIFETSGHCKHLEVKIIKNKCEFITLWKLFRCAEVFWHPLQQKGDI